MTDEEKLTLIQKYEELPAEEFKEECFEDLKKFAFDKDDTIKTFTASVLSRFVNTAKQKEAIEILLQLCHEENELVRTEAYDAIGCYCEESVVKSLEKAVLSEKDGLARSYAIDSWIYVQQHLCTNETEVIGYLNAILEKESNNNCILNCLYGKYSFGEKNVLNGILNYIKNTDYHIRYSVLAIIQLILEDENYTEECKNYTYRTFKKGKNKSSKRAGRRSNEVAIMWHIWTIDDWEKNIDLTREGHRTGLRLRFDKDIDSEVRRACKEFAVFLRREYFFPIRVVVYIKNVKKLTAMDGDKVYGTFWSMYDDYNIEPHIRVAAGDYTDLCHKWGKDSALTAILSTIAHELTHYFQWINALKLTPIGQERQATNYARYILDEYAETREHP